jgi:chromate transport protein ChrA
MPEAVPFRSALRVWTLIGLASFGGPAARISLMHRVLVDEKRWIGEGRFAHALNFCMLLPGPEAMQLATYVGWLLHGYRGGIAAGLLFVLPGFAAILALSLIYTTFGDVARFTGSDSVYALESLFFSKAAVVTFGGAYAVLAYIAQQAVEVYGWLQPGEMLDGLGMAETTPGPLIQVVQFVGYMGAYRDPGILAPWLAGVFGSVVVTWVTFVPCFLWIFLGAPYMERIRGNVKLQAALSAVTAAVLGVILNLALWFGIHALFRDVAARTVGPLRLLVPDWSSLDVATLAIAVAASLALLRLHMPVIPVILAGAGAGVVYRLVLVM